MSDEKALRALGIAPLGCRLSVVTIEGVETAMLIPIPPLFEFVKCYDRVPFFVDKRAALRSFMLGLTGV